MFAGPVGPSEAHTLDVRLMTFRLPPDCITGQFVTLPPKRRFAAVSAKPVVTFAPVLPSALLLALAACSGSTASAPTGGNGGVGAPTAGRPSGPQAGGPPGGPGGPFGGASQTVGVVTAAASEGTLG